MGQNPRRLKIHEPAVYRIRVQGVLEERWADYMGGMAIFADVESGPHPVTTLTGQLLDQAELMGILNHLYNLHFPLLLVECLANDAVDESIDFSEGGDHTQLGQNPP